MIFSPSSDENLVGKVTDKFGKFEIIYYYRENEDTNNILKTVYNHFKIKIKVIIYLRKKVPS